ncbi:6342_t:CDS:1, partial [Acaulospora morrowiae]
TGSKVNRKEVAKLSSPNWRKLAETKKNKYVIRAHNASKRDLSNNVFDSSPDNLLDATYTVPEPTESLTVSESEYRKLEHSSFDVLAPFTDEEVSLLYKYGYRFDEFNNFYFH